MVFDPPVSWLNSSSGRASASVTETRSTGRSSSSAMSIAVDVVMPWPFSERGSANRTIPSVPSVSVISIEVGAAASVWASVRSRSSAGPGSDGMTAGAVAACAASGRAIAIASVGAATR